MTGHKHPADIDIDAVLNDPDGLCPDCVRLLAEARAYAEGAAKEIAAAQDQATLAREETAALRVKFARAERERDEARAELSIVRDALGDAEKYTSQIRAERDEVVKTLREVSLAVGHWRLGDIDDRGTLAAIEQLVTAPDGDDEGADQ